MGWTFYNSSGQRLQAFGFVAATQAEMEAASSTTAYVTPGRTHNHPGVAKVWVAWEQTDAHGILASYNMTSTTDGGVGDTDHLWDVDFSSANYALAGFSQENYIIHGRNDNRATTGITTVTKDNAGSAADSDENTLIVMGDQ